MKLLFSAALLVASNFAQAASIPMMSFPVKNGIQGEVYNMADHPNSVFVFEAYRLSCHYCNENAPNVDRLKEEFRDNTRVQVLDLGLDTSSFDYSEWIRRHNPNHPVIQDVGRKVYNTLRTENGIPQTFVVDCKGNMTGNVVGEWDQGGEQKVRKLIDTALAVQCE
ncbi:MAG: TlpA disulfide reductase family protein [Proteobacteria bacterium]|nr:TlpA disulfide reductase family protein [Pseudomonadota bacterium]